MLFRSGFGRGGVDGDHRDLHSFPTRRSSDLLTGIYQGRTDPYRLPADLAFAERRWAHQQAHAGFGGLLAACEPAWLNHPRHVLHATLLPVQLAAAEASGLAVPPTVITNITGAARAFTRGRGDRKSTRLNSSH